MVSTAQRKLAHYIASLGIWPYSRLVQLMEERSALIEGYKAMRQEFDRPQAERLLIDAYRFCRKGSDWCQIAYGNALWAYMRRHYSSTAQQRYEEIEGHLVAYLQAQGIDQSTHDARLNADANRYLLERIAFCLREDPFADEWKARQAEAHQHYEFWWTRLDPWEGPAWRELHPRNETPLLWKITQPGTPTAATPLVCLPGTIEYACATARLAYAQLEAWERSFGLAAHDTSAAQLTLSYYATEGVPPDDVPLFNLSGVLSRDQIAEAIRCTIGAYTDAVGTIRQADVPLVLRHPIDPSEHAVESQVRAWTRFLERVQALSEER